MEVKNIDNPYPVFKKPQQIQETQKALELIKTMNGFSDKIMQHPDKIEQIELVLEELDRMLVGLQNLQQLKQLWIAGNQIEDIRINLDKLQNLNDLNISGNKICSFKEALNLNRLPNLKQLSFYDPHFGENPICNLCNYQTYVLYHLRNITKLDTLFISEEAKSFAEATFMKKKMYYNMRIKTMQRSFSTLGKLIRKAMKIKLDSYNEDIANIQLKLWQLQSQFNNLKEDIEIQKYQTMKTEKLEEIGNLEQIYEEMKRKLYENSSLCIHKLITELETGGNIRLEEGKSNEKWYISCEDLIKSRFNADDMIGYGIQDLQIKRVVRIHNRFLRNKFEEKMESLVDISNSNYKKNLEYLFYGIDPNAPQEIYHVIEEGFRPFSECKQLGLCGYTPLVNNILGADSARLMSFLKKSATNLQKQAFMKKKFKHNFNVFPPGLLLICKVLMIKSVQDTKQPFFDHDQAPSDIFKNYPIDNTLVQEENAVFRTKENDNKHKLWFVIDNNLVLPEYLVEYNYILKTENQNKIADFGPNNLGVLDNPDDEFISPKNFHVYKNELNNIYNALCEEINNYQFENIEDLKHPNLEIKAQDLDRADISLIKIPLLNYFKFCLSRSFLYELNPNILTEANEISLNEEKQQMK
ncbi:leucine rich repeat protein [Ichthyophthirius multifiliis]|uniref:Leucine rich repeat protein n=1 Tax=Ichthyophthirius multifiliis TaxID=5932 RepID=G0QS60_ICHMU|nr:leucine rich repeat protein [Ichthyophthirius multifiliis]EGR31925.1 leucine rich repeat protein [Ichthyophthirius multifiliis]|eukprot:XP_004035411.1 leucine rich repeat protein [Ichthyophthirius multifiliis]